MTKTIAEPISAAAKARSPISTRMRRTSSRQANAVVITAHGDMDAVRIPELRGQLAAALGALDSGWVILDMGDVEFLSLCIARELVEAKHRADRCGLDIRLVVQSKAVQRALDVTGAFLLFPAYPSVKAATEGKLPTA